MAALVTASSLALSACNGDKAGQQVDVAPPTSEASNLPVETFDIAVFGDGPGAVMAALGAADSGQSVVLISPRAGVAGDLSGGAIAPKVDFLPSVDGRTRDFLLEANAALSGDGVAAYSVTPDFAKSWMSDALSKASVTIIDQAELGSVNKTSGTIESLDLADRRIAAARFIDASVEGDLMAASGVEFVLGREGEEGYGEQMAGSRALSPRLVGGDASVFSAVPYVIDGGANPYGDAGPSKGDARVMAGGLPVCLTPGRGPVPAPSGYNAADFAFVTDAAVRSNADASAARVMNKRGGGGQDSGFFDLTKGPEGRYALSSARPFGLYDLPGFTERYLAADKAGRDAEVETLRNYVHGLIYTLQTSPQIDGAYASAKQAFAGYGLCDGGLPSVPVLPETRRMVGASVLTQTDLTDSREKADSVMTAANPIQLSDVRWVISGNRLLGEGATVKSVPIYEVPYSVLLPKAGQADNLLVSGTPSVSHVAWGSVGERVNLMMLGEIAGLAAAQSLSQSVSPRAIDMTALQSNLRERGFDTDITDLCDDAIHPNFHNAMKSRRGLDMERCAVVAVAR